MAIGVIGGSGLYAMEGLETLREVSVATPYGEPSAPYRIGAIHGKEIVFLPRHGAAHTVPPHKVNYRANIWGFKSLGVERIIAVNAVGGINRDLKAGMLVVPDQIIDLTGGARAHTFYEGGKVIHIDFSEPYCPELRAMTIAAAGGLSLPLAEAGTYVCTNGPRLETAGEIRFCSVIGADIVGMTAMPETALAREMEICFVCIAVVTNPAAGIAAEKLTATEVVQVMKGATDALKRLVQALIPVIPSQRSCPCKDALKGAEI